MKIPELKEVLDTAEQMIKEERRKLRVSIQEIIDAKRNRK